jgi:uncharacterized protein (DUF488 family)
MEKSTIYSIGHGNKSIDQLIEELNSFDIQYVIDVRSTPFSKYNPQFNRNLVEMDLMNNGIAYEFFGEYLGGLPKDPSCYIDGKVDYNVIKTKQFFRDAIDLIIGANEEKMKLALLCSESKPEECHRSKLIGQVLIEKKIEVNHIISKGYSRTQIDVMSIYNKGKNLKNLFEEINLTSRKTY